MRLEPKGTAIASEDLFKRIKYPVFLHLHDPMYAPTSLIYSQDNDFMTTIFQTVVLPLSKDFHSTEKMMGVYFWTGGIRANQHGRWIIFYYRIIFRDRTTLYDPRDYETIFAVKTTSKDNERIILSGEVFNRPYGFPDTFFSYNIIP